MADRLLAMALFPLLAVGIASAGIRLLGAMGLRPRRWSWPDLGIACAVGLGAMVLVLFALGAGGLLRPWCARMLAGALIAHGLLHLRTIADKVVLRFGPLPRGRLPRLCLGAFLALLAVQFIDGTNFVTGKDAISYHFPIVKEMLERRSIEPAPYIVESCMMPQNVHLLFAFGALILNEVLGKFFLWLFALGSHSILFGLTSRLLGRSAAWLAVFIYAFTPWTNYKVHCPFVEGGIALFLLAAAYGLVMGRGGRRRCWVLSAIMVGLAMGTKQSAWIAAPLLAGFAGWLVWREDRSPWLVALGKAFGLAGLALLVGAPWYLRNWVYLGNPVWPMLFGGNFSPSGYWSDPVGIVSRCLAPRTLMRFARTILLSYGDDCFSLFHPALAILTPWVAARSWRDGRYLALSILAAVSLAFCYAFASYSSRYWFPYYAIFCAALGGAAARLASNPRLRWALWVLAATMAGCTLAYETLATYQVARLWTRDLYEEHMLAPRRICRLCEERCPPNKRILALAETSLSFHVPAVLADTRQRWLNLLDVETPGVLLSRLREREIGVILVDREKWSPFPPKEREDVLRALTVLCEEGFLTLLRREGPYEAYLVSLSPDAQGDRGRPIERAEIPPPRRITVHRVR